MNKKKRDNNDPFDGDIDDDNDDSPAPGLDLPEAGAEFIWEFGKALGNILNREFEELFR